MWAYGRVKPGSSRELSGCYTENSPMTMSVFSGEDSDAKSSIDCTNVFHLNTFWKCCVKLCNRRCSTSGRRTLMGSVITRQVQIRLLGLLWHFWSVADELLRCGRVKALGKCRWDHTGSRHVSHHMTVSRRGKYISTQILCKLCNNRFEIIVYLQLEILNTFYCTMTLHAPYLMAEVFTLQSLHTKHKINS